MSQQQGFVAENMARDYLLRQGLTWRESNYRTSMGEIDLVMQEKNCLVFVEVRARRSAVFGGALESITVMKQRKLLKTALSYLQRYRLEDKMSSRFDVVVMQGEPPTIQWIPNAFGSDF